MTVFIRAQVELDNDSGEDKDKVVNTWHFSSDEVSVIGLDYGDILVRLHTFYTSIDQYLSENLSGVYRVKFYNLLEPPERVPVVADPATTLTPGAGALPNELAVCLSYRSVHESGVRKSRRRGRLYIGPLANLATVVIDGTGDALVDNDIRNDLAAAAGLMVGNLASVSNSDIRWCVFSRADYEDAAPPGVENSTVGFSAAFHEVTGGRIDNAFDVQRRRGRVATSSSLFGNGWF